MDNSTHLPLSPSDNLNSFDEVLLPAKTRGPPAQPYGGGNVSMGGASTPSDDLSDGLSGGLSTLAASPVLLSLDREVDRDLAMPILISVMATLTHSISA